VDAVGKEQRVRDRRHAGAPDVVARDDRDRGGGRSDRLRPSCCRGDVDSQQLFD
jgi:hypothetical protein